MIIPPEVIIGNQKLPTLLIVCLFGFLYWVFIVWYEGRKDGFDSEKTLDLAFSSMITGFLAFFLFSSAYNHALIYSPESLFFRVDYELSAGLVSFLGTLLPVLFLSKKWNWSKYRLLDIYAMASALFIFFFGIGRFLVYGDLEFLALSSLILPFYLLVLRFRGYRFSSGVIFSFFVFFLVAFGLIMLRRSGYLLIYGSLFILSIANLFFRRKRSVYKRNLPAELIASIKSKLLAKDKGLKESQQQLIKEDPYLQEDRATANSESMDEAILEDYQKTVTDAEMGIVRRLRVQVKRALAAIKLGKYGTCEVCGLPIDPARLRVYPEATTCIECSTKISEAGDE
jgi:DnaK suppressor protein